MLRTKAKIKNSEPKEVPGKTIQARLTGDEVDNLELIKKTYGHRTDSTIMRFLISQVASNIRSGKPSILINA